MHTASIKLRRFQVTPSGNRTSMLRKLLWSGLYAGIGAAATMGARRAASSIWRLATGEEPPAKR
jgi:CRISPR/Cas system endoribonuclease Cas6 (RAMP superfamily)